MENLPAEFLSLWKDPEQDENCEYDDEFWKEQEKRWKVYTPQEQVGNRERDTPQATAELLGAAERQYRQAAVGQEGSQYRQPFSEQEGSWQAASEQEGSWQAASEQEGSCQAAEEQEVSEEEESPEKKRRAPFSREVEKRMSGWKPSEMDLLMDISDLLTQKKMDELETLYAKKLDLKEQRRVFNLEILKWFHRTVKLEELDVELMEHFYRHFPEYFIARVQWSLKNPNLVFEDITNILPMTYTDEVPRYVFAGSSHSLQIYSVKVVRGGFKKEQWPLHVYGVIAVRDSIDPKRNLIFNRSRAYCQVITKEDPYLVLTGPTHAVGMNGDVHIEAELKMKGAVASEDDYLIAEAKTIPVMFGLDSVVLSHRDGNKLDIAVGGLHACVEATIFIRVIDGTWPAGFHGQFFACTTSMKHKKIILIEFGGDDVNMVHLRHVVSVRVLGELTVSFNAWKGDKEVSTMSGDVMFKAEMSGRSFGYLKVGSCNLGVLVVWSRIRPMLEELVPEPHLDLVV